MPVSELAAERHKIQELEQPHNESSHYRESGMGMENGRANEFGTVVSFAEMEGFGSFHACLVRVRVLLVFCCRRC